jgi:hypothetical protein
VAACWTAAACAPETAGIAVEEKIASFSSTETDSYLHPQAYTSLVASQVVHAWVLTTANWNRTGIGVAFTAENGWHIGQAFTRDTAVTCAALP